MPLTHAVPRRTPPPGGRGVIRRVAKRAAAGAAAFAVAAGPMALSGAALAKSVGNQQSPPGQLSITIESVSPQWATPGRTVTVTGIVRNGTPAAQVGVSVQLRSSAGRFNDRDELAQYTAGSFPADVPEGEAVPLPGVIAPGRTVHWRATLDPAAAGITRFGVYPLAAQVLTSAGIPATTDRTFLPFWAGEPRAQQPKQLSIAWVWPLIDQPHQATCSSLLSNGLASSLAAGGRLNGLLAAAASHSAAAHLTWAIDPALVQSVHKMESRYSVGGRPGCGGARPMPGSRPARSWLGNLASATSGQQVFLTPYADVDVAALSHDGLDSDLRSAFAQGRSIGQQILHLPSSDDTIAWPQGGIADSGVLGSLAVVKGISTVVLDSTVMPPAGAIPNYTPSAQTSAASGVGSSLHVLLADHTVSQLLARTPASGPGATFATEQSFLAQTAMIVAEAPALARSLVVTPPSRWDPAPGLASGLLSETVHAPWLRPASLADLATAAHPSGQVSRKSPPAHKVSKAELSPAFLARVARLDAAIKVQAGILSPPDSGYLSSAIAALESSAWRGDGQAGARQNLLGRVSSYVSLQGRKVSIIVPGQITLGGSSGKVPVSVSNGLNWRNVQVKLQVRTPGDGRLSIGKFDPVVTIPAGKTITVRLPVHAAAVGATDVTLRLLNPDGSPLPGTRVRLPVHATKFGTLALIVMSVALGVFVLTSAARAIRRSRKDGGPAGDPAPEPPGPAAIPGSVGSVHEGHEGDDLANDHPPEDPDEYADARGRARR
ncbi:MAG TPA: DUF6049 family protein [Streptosporangiaceae bacterium]